MNNDLLTGQSRSKQPEEGTRGIPIPGERPVKKSSTQTPQDLKVADFVRVYVLGDGPQGRVIEEHAGQTGYHIRTIPSARYSQPVMVAAGAGYLAVVDRFGGGDVIRITDRYAGAGAGSFDENGFPVDSINWGGIGDILQIATGGLVTGLQILPRGILIAAINMGNGVPTFIKWDVQGNFALYNGTFTLPAPFDALGDAVGRISPVDQTQTKWAHEILAIVQSGQGNCLLKIDFLSEKVTGLIGLPDGVPYGVSNAGGLVSVQMGDSNGITAIYRMERVDDSGFMSGVYSDKFVPVPDNGEGVSSTFNPLDVPNENLVNYYYLAQVLNNRFGAAQSVNEETAADPAVAQGGRAISGTTGSNNDNRVSTPTTYTTRFYGPLYQVPVQQILNVGPTIIVDSDVVNNTIVELLTLTPVDSTKPLFRLVHGTHYDYLSDGGFTYGCRTPGQDIVTPITSGLQPVSIAIDKSSEPGKLKELPDLKVALVDKKTGLLLYTGTKSLGFNWYGGTSAGLKLTTEALAHTKKTECSTVQDTAIDATLDGVNYQYGADGAPTVITRDAAHLAQFATPADGRRPWPLFIPRIINSGKVSVQPIDSRSVVTRLDSGGYLDWWLPAGARTYPAQTIVSKSQLFYPPKGPNTPIPDFQVSCSSGFFGLNWAKQENRSIDEHGDPFVTFTTPASLLDYKINGLAPTPATDPDLPEVVTALPELIGEPLFAVESGLGEHPTLPRAVMFDTDIRSWIAVEIKLDRDGFISDGVAAWTQPSAYENGLGVRVGGSAASAAGHMSGFTCNGPRGKGIQPASGYDFGDTAFDGAQGRWQVEVFANGRPIGAIGHRVTFPEQIEGLAPAEAQDALLQTFLAGGAGPLGYHKGKVYYSRELITEVTIRAKLVNYAYNVFRVGFHTLSFDHDDYIGSGPVLCPGADPGFYAGNNCEAICCGNVSCLSQIFFGNKLYAGDPIRQRVVNTLWEGQATFAIPAANNPYAAQGVAVGNLFNAYLQFLLNTSMTAYNVNLRSGDSSK